MIIRVTMVDKVLHFELRTHASIDKMVDALKENLPGWVKIEVIIVDFVS
jgi:hypothetical protein